MAQEPMAAIDIEIGAYDEVEQEANRKLAPNTYMVNVKAMPEVRYAKASGNAYLAWQLETIDCEDPADNGFVIFHNTPVQGKGRTIFFRFAEAFGMKWEGGTLTSEFLESFVGEEVFVTTSIRTWEGKDQVDVKSVSAKDQSQTGSTNIKFQNYGGGSGAFGG